MQSSVSPNKIGLYYRPSLKPWAKYQPGIMSLVDGRIAFKTKDHQLFDADIAHATAMFTLFGTLIVTIDTVSYAFVTGTTASIAARPFTEDQLKELATVSGVSDNGEKFLAGAATAGGGNIAANVMSSAAGRGLGVAGGVAGTVVMEKAQYRSFEMILTWATYLEKNGVKTTFKTHSYTKQVIVLCAIILPLFTLLVLGIYLIVLQFS